MLDERIKLHVRIMINAICIKVIKLIIRQLSLMGRVIFGCCVAFCLGEFAAAESVLPDICADAKSNFQNSDPDACLSALPSLSEVEQSALVQDYLEYGRTYIEKGDLPRIVRSLSRASADRLNVLSLLDAATERRPQIAQDLRQAMRAAQGSQDRILQGYLHLAYAELARAERDKEDQAEALNEAMAMAADFHAPGLQLRIRFRRAEMTYQRGAYSIAREEYGMILSGAVRMNNSDLAGDACRMLGYSLSRDTSVSDEKLQRLSAEAKRAQKTHYPCFPFAALHRAQQKHDDMASIAARAEEALRAAQENSYNTIPPVIFNSLAINAKRMGDYVNAADYYRQAADAHRANKNLFMVAATSSNLGLLMLDLGDTARALELFQDNLETMEQIAPHRLDAIFKSQRQIGDALAKSGKHSEALEWFERASKNSSDQMFQVFNGVIRTEYAQSLFEIGDEDRAIDMALKAADDLMDVGARPQHLVAASAYIWAANKRLERAQLGQAEALFSKAYDIMNPERKGPEYLLDARGDLVTRIEFARGVSDLYTQLNRPDEAGAYARVALELSETRFANEKLRAVANAELQFAMKEQQRQTEALSKDMVIATLGAERSRRQSAISLMAALLALAIALLLAFALRSQRKIAEMRELFMLEIQHRTKNNLQVLSSLLNMDARREAKSSSSQGSAKDAANRARAMALINDHMYELNGAENVEVKPFLADLLDLIHNSLGRKNIKLNHTSEEVSISADDATPLGLLICELVTNAYKHAFKNKVSGKISVKLSRKMRGLALEVCDNGQGFSGDPNKLREGSMGLELVEDLTSQLGGTLSVGSTSEGTVWMLDGLLRNRVAMQTAKLPGLKQTL